MDQPRAQEIAKDAAEKGISRQMKLRDGLGRKFSLRSIRGRRRSKT